MVCQPLVQLAALPQSSLILDKEKEEIGGLGENPEQHQGEDEQMFEALLRELEDEDLVAVAAYTFMEKQLWFLDKLDKLQVPYSVGCVRMEVRRKHCLQDTLVLVGGLSRSDMHKVWRVQFANEAGLRGLAARVVWAEISV